MYTPDELMQLAIEKARAGMAAGQSPFGCAIARGGKLLACAHNTVLDTPDITAHAEINALRIACQDQQDIFLEGCLVASTCEPCPMCMSALHWARVDAVCYGASIADATAAGFKEIQLPAAEIVRIGGGRVKLQTDVAVEECRQLFVDWQNLDSARTY